ncbi:MAG: galactokinase family protein [Terriglobia bacterium]|jgi:hypothetical protein
MSERSDRYDLIASVFRTRSGAEPEFLVRAPGRVDFMGSHTDYNYGWTLYGARGNSENHTREVMTMIWLADGARATVPDNQDRARDLQRWLPALKPGDFAASNLNPLAWGRDSRTF